MTFFLGGGIGFSMLGEDPRIFGELLRFRNLYIESL